MTEPKPTPAQIHEAARRLGLTTAAIYNRRASGRTWAEALTEPKWTRDRSGRKGRHAGGWGVNFFLPGSVKHRRPGAT